MLPPNPPRRAAHSVGAAGQGRRTADRIPRRCRTTGEATAGSRRRGRMRRPTTSRRRALPAGRTPARVARAAADRQIRYPRSGRTRQQMPILAARKIFRQQGARAGQATQANSIRDAATAVPPLAARPQAVHRRGTGRMPTSMSNRGAIGAATRNGLVLVGRQPVPGPTPTAETSVEMDGIPTAPIRTARIRMSPAWSVTAWIAASRIQGEWAARAATRSASPARRPDCGHMTNLTGAATPARTADRSGKAGPAGTATLVLAAVRAGTRAPLRGYQRSRAVETGATPVLTIRTGRALRMVPTARAGISRSGKAREADPPGGGTDAGAAGVVAATSQPGRRDPVATSGRARHRPRHGPAEMTNSSRCLRWWWWALRLHPRRPLSRCLHHP